MVGKNSASCNVKSQPQATAAMAYLDALAYLAGTISTVLTIDRRTSTGSGEMRTSTAVSSAAQR